MAAQWNSINNNYKDLDGYKRVAWPPASEERIVHEFTPQPQVQYQPELPYNQQEQPYQSSAVPLTQQYQTHQQQSQQYSPQIQHQSQVLSHIQYQQHQQHPQYQQPQLEKQFQQPHWVQQQHLPQPYKVPTQQAPYEVPKQQQALSYQPQQYQQKQPEYSLNNHQVPHQQYQAPSQNQFVSQPNQQFNSNSQTQQPRTVSHDQTDKLIQEYHHDQRGGSPGIITLRKEAPVSQAPAPVYTSQPAAVSYHGGSNLRGDLKWPPPECKEAMARENEERRQLALGPVCRPRQVKRDYSPFFAKNALSHHYPSYKVPPGTQHMYF